MAHQAQLANVKYRNWVRAGLGIKYVKEGLEPFCDHLVTQQHIDILNKVKQTHTLAAVACGKCDVRTLQPNHVRTRNKQCPLGQRDCNCQYPGGKMLCPNNVCGAIYDEIIQLHASTPPAPYWKNTDARQWSTEPWTIAKCFINAPGYENKTKASWFDCPGLLHLLINNKGFQQHIKCAISGTDVFSRVRKSRNAIFHSHSMELEDKEVNRYIDDMIELLEDEKELKYRQESKDAVKNLIELKQTNFTISTADEDEILRIAKDAIGELQQIKKDSINEIQTIAAEGKCKLEGKCLAIKSEFEHKREKIKTELIMKEAELKEIGENIKQELVIREDESEKKLEQKGIEIEKQLTRKKVEVEEKLQRKLNESTLQLELKQEDFIISTTDEAGVRRVAMAAINEKKRELEQTIVDATNELRTEAAEGKRKLRAEGLVIKSELEQKRKKIRKEVMMKNSELEQTGQNIEKKLTIREDESKKKLEKKGKDIVKQLTKTRVETEEKLGYKLQESKAQLESHKNMIESSMTSTAETIKEAVTSKKKEVSQMPDRNQLQLPKEITDMDDETVKTYIRALEKGKTKYNSIRIMVVGHFKVGKTTLVKRLFGQFKDEETTLSTNGIETHVRRCNVNLEDEDEKVTWKPSIHGNKTNWKQVLSQKAQNITADDTSMEKTETTFVTQSEFSELENVELENVERNDSTTVPQSGEEAKEEVKVPVLLPKKEEEQSKEQHNLNQQECIKTLVQNIPKGLGDNTNKVNISVWDFAGQYAFYNTHQVFLARRAIYLIVTDMSKDIKDEVNDTCYEDSTGARKLRVLDFARFWLNSIHEFCQTGKKGEPPVLLVGTFADEYAKKENMDQTKYPEVKKQLEKKYFYQLKKELTFGEAKDHIVKYFMIDNTCTVDRTSSQFEELKREILAISKEQSYIGDLIPTKFLLLEEALNKKREEGKKILNIETDFSKCNEELPFKLNEEEVDVFLRFYHEVGSFIYFSENNLKNYILLEPQWLIDAFKELITAEEFMLNGNSETFEIWQEFNETAILKKVLIDKCWEGMAMSLTERTLLLEYMEKLGLIVKDRENRDSYFAPCVLKQAPSEELLKLGDIKEGKCPFTFNGKTFTSKLCYTTRSKFIPMAIFNRLLASCMSRWNIRKEFNHENGEERVDIYCGCGIFSLPNAHILYVHFRDNVVQIWIVRCSDNSPSKKICLDVKKHMDDFFGSVFKKCEVEIHFKCPTGCSTKNAMHTHDYLKTYCSVLCNDHKYELSSLSLTGCWFQDDRCNDSGTSSSEISRQTGHPFKKEYDDTFCQSMVTALHEQMKSVGVLVSGGNPIGTVFRVGSSCVMTAFHVIKIVLDPSESGSPDAARLESENTFINFNESPFTHPVVAYKLRKEFIYNADLDVAVLEILNPFDLPKKLKLRRAATGATNVSLIGYGHPGQPNKCFLDPKCQIVLPNSERIQSAQAWLQQNSGYYRSELRKIGLDPSLVDNGYQGYDHPSKIVFDCYVEQGASGAPLLTTDNQSVEVVGILTHGFPELYYILPPHMKHHFPDRFRLEMGSKMQDIFEWIQAEMPGVIQDMFG